MPWTTCGNGTRVPSTRATSAAEALGPDAVELVRLVEADLARHESAINEHHRTALTIRGLMLTAVAALVAVSYTSFVALPDYFALLAAVLFLGADYFYSRLYLGVEQRIPVLESLSASYRRLLVRPARTRDSLDDFKGDLRAYSARPVAPDPHPRLWPPGPVGRLKVFIPVYVVLAVFAGMSAWYIETHTKPGTLSSSALSRQWCCSTLHSHPMPLWGTRGPSSHR